MHDRFPVALEIPFNLLHTLQKGQFLYEESEIYVVLLQYTYELVWNVFREIENEYEYFGQV